MIVVYFDGACEPYNPHGIATYGFVIYRGYEKKIAEGKGLAAEPFSYKSSNNVAEYTAMIKALELLIERRLNNEEVIVKGDSQLIIRQMQGRYNVNAPRITPLYKKAKELVSQFRNIKFIWIPREENEEADELSHMSYDMYLNKHPEVADKIRHTFATEKQKKFMERLKIKYDKYISKRECSRLIQRKLERMKENE